MDIRYHGIGNLVSIQPLNDRARDFIAAQWPKGTPDIIPDTEGGRLMSRDAFVGALVLIADAGLEAVLFNSHGRPDNWADRVADKLAAIYRKAGSLAAQCEWDAITRRDRPAQVDAVVALGRFRQLVAA